MDIQQVQQNRPIMIVPLMCIIYALITLELDYIDTSNHFTMPILAIGYVLGVYVCVTTPFKIRKPLEIRLSIIYGLIVVFSICLNPTDEPVINDIIKNTVWIVLFYMGYLWSAQNYNFDKTINIINYGILPIAFILYYIILSKTFFMGAYYGYRDAIFSIAVLSPFALFSNKKILRYALIMVSLILIILSAKRSVILGTIIGLIIYILKLYKGTTKKK